MGGGKRVFVKNATCKYHTLFQFCTKWMIAGGPGKIPRSEACWPCVFSWWPACPGHAPGQCGVLASTWSRLSTRTRGLWRLDQSCCRLGHSVSQFYLSNLKDPSVLCLTVWDNCLPSLLGQYSSGSYSKLFWFSSSDSQHDGITARGTAKGPTPSVPAYSQRPLLSRWLPSEWVLPCFVWTTDGNALVKR